MMLHISSFSLSDWLMISLFISTDFTQTQLSAEVLHSLTLHKKSFSSTPTTLPFVQSNIYHASIPTGKVYLCGMKDVTTVSFSLVVPDLKTRSLHDLMVLHVAKELLAGFEGPFWRAIRGKGLSYDFGLYV